VTARPLALLLLLVPAAANAAGPVRPVVPDEAAQYSSGTALHTGEPDEWWTSLQDPALNALVVEALEANHDLGAAQARLHQAAGITLQSVSPLLPTTSVDVGVHASPTSNSSFQTSPQLTALLEDLAELADRIPGQPADDEDDEDEDEDPTVIWNGSALVNLGLSIDLGRSATALRAAQLDAAAAKDDRDGVARIVIQQVVAAWLDVRTARARVAVVQEQIQTNTALLELTRARFLGADARGLDVLQQQQQLAATRALLPQVEQFLRLREIQLATLLARDPSAPGLPPDSGLPTLPPPPGLGTPADLMETRPDVAAAHHRYLSARTRAVSSALAFAPTFRLTGSVGYQLRWFKEWESQETWGLGAAVSIPIFGGLQRQGALRQALAARDSAARTLSSTALAAQAEVESALAREETGIARLEALTDLLSASTVAYEESARQYRDGVVNYLTVLTSLASMQAAELNHLQAQRDVLGARIDLHTALGAPWAARLDSGGPR
jgi:multidrug efflux system outer membrane protein